MKSKSASKQLTEGANQDQVRRRILDAAFSAFTERGYAETSTLEIATRAKVSKRDFYALVGRKQEMLVACITERAQRLGLPADMPVPRDREALAKVLAEFGAQLLREVSNPAVIAMFRLAIAEAERVPEIAHALDSIGREASRTALKKMLDQAQSSGLLSGETAEMVKQFTALLWGDLMVSLLLRVADTPEPQEITQRAHNAAIAFLQIYPQSNQDKITGLPQ